MWFGAIIAGTFLAIGLVDADAAMASTTSCTTGTYAGYCGTQVSATGGSVNRLLNF
jgi:hypothetical protein